MTTIPPRTADDLTALVQAEVQESLHLDYKAGAALSKSARDEISKDASAFANSDGGIIIYGIEEKDHLPVRVDGGVDHRQITREWVEHVLQANVAPKIPDLEILQIPISPNTSAFVVSLQKSYRGPHQDRPTKRFYKRYNFESCPMENYEIEDIRTRATLIPPLVSVSAAIKAPSLCMIAIENTGDTPARNVYFEVPDGLTWRHRGEPLMIFERGIKYFAPGKRFEVLYNLTYMILGKKEGMVSEFDIGVSYEHPLTGRRMEDVFHINFQDYLGTWALKSDVQEHGERLEKVLEKTARALGDIQSSLRILTGLVAPTGLGVSFSTLRNLATVLGVEFRPRAIDPSSQTYAVFQELLAVDLDLAVALEDYFRGTKSLDGIHRAIPELPDAVFEDLRSYFAVEDKKETGSEET